MTEWVYPESCNCFIEITISFRKKG